MTTPKSSKEQPARRDWRAAVKVYGHPRVIGMLFLGFAAGLPLLLTGGTFTAWLRDLDVDLASIGFLSWVGMAYSIKVFWAPVVDRLDLPWLTRRFGRRRAWMLLAQATIILGLTGIALTDPTERLWLVAVLAVLTAFGAATQDIAIDAYRIEAVTPERQGAMAASYVTGYRVALLTAGAGALHVAAAGSWSMAYGSMALLMLVGVVSALIVREPEVSRRDSRTEKLEERVVDYLNKTRDTGWWRDLKAWLIGAVVCPFVDFWQRYRKVALLVIAFIGIFRISDIFMGVMANPFYLDLGFGKDEIANIAAAFGLAMTLTGAAVGGLLVVRFGMMRMLIATAVLAPLTNLTFSWLALLGPETYGLVFAIMADNLSGGMAISVFIAYLSSLTSTAYTATQYALFSSLMTLPGQFLAGFTGVMAERLGWFWFFITSALIGIPTIILALLLRRYANPDLRVAERQTDVEETTPADERVA